MKLAINIITIFIVMSGFFLFFPGEVAASGTTNSQTQPGQVQLRSEGDTVYLGTNVTEGGNRNTATTSGTTGTQPRPRFSRALGETIIKPPGFAENIGQYINALLSIVMAVAVLLVFFYFILAGLQWITSGGDKGKTENARNKIVNAFVGVIILASTFALATFVAYILGFESINEALMNIRRINPS